MGPIRIATYNVHKCKGMDGRIRPGRISEVLQEINADVVGLQEVLSLEGGPREENQAKFLADELGMQLAVGENRKIGGGAYGNIVLSRYPLHSHCNHNVSVHGYEPRGCMQTDIQLPNDSTLHVFNVHFGTGFMERRKQAQMLLERELIRGNGLSSPRIVMGDFNEWTAGRLTKVLRTEFKGTDILLQMGRRKTYPGWLPFLHLDHIYYDNDLTAERVALHRTKKSLIASDHLPIVADFQLK